MGNVRHPAGICGALLAIATLAVLLGCTALQRLAVRDVAPPTALTAAQRDPRNGSSWVIVYSPHPDDETIGMGQLIHRYVKAGYNVQVVLLSDGETSHAYRDYYLKHPELWRDLDGGGTLGDVGDFGLERRLEFTRACGILGVPLSRLSFYGVASGSKDGLASDFISSTRVEQIMQGFASKHPGALHVTVMKFTDGRPDGPGDLYPQAQHRAACNALDDLARSEGLRAEFYKIYAYDLPQERRWAPAMEKDPKDHPVKVQALLNGYDNADEGGHLAIGWHSVSLTIDNVLADTMEYRVPLADVPPLKSEVGTSTVEPKRE